jgi:hypothetical protein
MRPSPVCPNRGGDLAVLLPELLKMPWQIAGINRPQRESYSSSEGWTR